MFFSFANKGGGGFFTRRSTEAAINLANVAFVEFGAVGGTPFAHVHFSGHKHICRIIGRDEIDRLRLSMADLVPASRQSGQSEEF